MHTTQRNQQISGTGQGITNLLRTVILGLALTMGLMLGNGSVQAEEGAWDSQQVQRNDREQADSKKDQQSRGLFESPNLHCRNRSVGKS